MSSPNKFGDAPRPLPSLKQRRNGHGRIPKPLQRERLFLRRTQGEGGRAQTPRKSYNGINWESESTLTSTPRIVFVSFLRVVIFLNDGESCRKTPATEGFSGPLLSTLKVRRPPGWRCKPARPRRSVRRLRLRFSLDGRRSQSPFRWPSRGRLGRLQSSIRNPGARPLVRGHAALPYYSWMTWQGESRFSACCFSASRARSCSVSCSLVGMEFFFGRPLGLVGDSRPPPCKTCKKKHPTCEGHKGSDLGQIKTQQ